MMKKEEQGKPRPAGKKTDSAAARENKAENNIRTLVTRSLCAILIILLFIFRHSIFHPKTAAQLYQLNRYGTLVTILLFFSNPAAALVFAIVYIIYAQIENNIISPKIQGDALNLQPVVILCAITIGMYMFGLLGAIIAIPIAGCIRVLVDEYPNIKAARE